jgi:hypothetical protein
VFYDRVLKRRASHARKLCKRKAPTLIWHALEELQLQRKSGDEVWIRRSVPAVFLQSLRLNEPLEGALLI